MDKATLSIWVVSIPALLIIWAAIFFQSGIKGVISAILIPFVFGMALISLISIVYNLI